MSEFTSANIRIPTRVYSEVVAFIARRGGMISATDGMEKQVENVTKEYGININVNEPAPEALDCTGSIINKTVE